MSNKISICIVTYNSMKYLPDFLESIFNQTYFLEKGSTPDIFIVDNASDDKTVQFIRDNFPTVHILRNVNNIGLPRAWNQAIKSTTGEYILIMNPDLILDENFIKRAIKVMNENKTAGSVGGKLYQLKIASMDEDMITLEKTNLLDSCGIQGFKNRRFVEQGSGQLDTGQFNQQEEVFGISGACAFYRRAALEQIKFNQEYFDEDFFMYKEDIDMAWRLRLAGWSAVYTPKAKAYHHRRAQSYGKSSDFEIAKHRPTKETFVNYHSYKNHLLLLYKNSLCNNFFKHLPYIFLYELKKFIYVLILENSTLRKTVRDLIKFRKKIKKKRQLNMRLKKVTNKEMGQWFR